MKSIIIITFLLSSWSCFSQDNPFGDDTIRHEGCFPIDTNCVNNIDRQIIKTVSPDSTLFSDNDTLVFKVFINAEGKVINAYCIQSQTTCTDQILLNRVIVDIKNELKYTAKKGARIESDCLTYMFSK